MKKGASKSILKKARCVSRLLAATMALTIVWSSSAFAMSIAYPSIYEIGEDTTYHQVEGTTAEGVQSVNYVEYQPNSGVTPMIAYGNGIYGQSTIRYVAEYLESSGYEVIAGINADFFDTTTGVPIGIVVKDGVFVCSSSSQQAIGFKADGSAVIGKPVTSMYLRGDQGSLIVENFNKTRTTYTVCMFDRNFGSSTRASTAGRNIIFERVDDTEIEINSSVQLRVVSTTDGLSAVDIGENQMVLSVSASGPTDRIPNYQVGDIVTFGVTCSDRSWDDVVYAVGGKVLLDNGTVDTTGSPTGTNPRTAVGVKADGTVVLYEVDGRQSGFSVGMSMSTLAAEMAALGCVDAINLDGGGSSAMIVQLPGDSTYDVVSSPSDGSLRRCANYIMLVNNASRSGSAAKLHLYPNYKYALRNADITLSVKATDSGYHPATTPANVSYSVASGSGTISGSRFTAGSANGAVQIQAAADGASGSGYVYVLSAVDAMQIGRAGTTSGISTLNVTGGSTTDLDVLSASFKNMQAAVSDSSVTWAVSGGIGSIDANGVFTASSAGGSGSITATYGSFVKTISTTVGTLVDLTPTSSDGVIADFESAKDFDVDNGATALSTAYGTVSRGSRSLKLWYSLPSATQTVLSYTGSGGDVSGSGQYLYLWVQGDASGAKLDALFTTADGSETAVTLASSLSGNAYQQLRAAVPAEAAKFAGLRLTKSAKNTGTIYIDQILMSSLQTADSTSPTVNLTSVAKTVTAGGSVSVVANIQDSRASLPASRIKAYIDGRSVNFSTNAQTGNISFSTGNLPAGTHRVTVEAVDAFGNQARSSADIMAGSGSGEKFKDTTGHWAKEYINFVAAKDIVMGETLSDGSNWFFPKRNLTRSEFAVIVARYLGLADSDVSAVSLPYADAARIPSWALTSVKALYQTGVMTGSSSNGRTVFNPTANVTRQEVMVVIGKSLPRGYATGSHTFADQASIPNWSLPHINYLVSVGIVGGYEDGTIKPTNNITRAEITKIIYNLY